MTNRVRWLLAAPAAVLAIAAVVALWPTSLGGATTYVTTHGTSMQPRFHAGDLVVVRASASYEPGDIVAYHSRLLDTVVLHRVVRIDGGRYTFKGDNNPWLDRDRPARADLIGTVWFAVPTAGRLAATPWARVAVLAGGLTALLSTQTAPRRRRRRGTGRPTDMQHRQSPRTSAGLLRRATGGAALAALVLCGVTAAAWLAPTTHRGHATVRYTDRAHLEYAADVADSTVYGGAIDPGEPVYRRLANTVAVRVTYDLDTPGSVDAAGTIALSAEIAARDGWRRTIPLGAPATFAGTHATAYATLDLQQLDAIITEVETATGVTAASHTVSVIARIAGRGRIDGVNWSATFAPRFVFELDPLQLRLIGDPSRPADTLTARASHSLDKPVSQPNTVGVGDARVAVATMRPVSAAALVCALILAAGLAWRLRYGESGEPSRIAARHGHLLVPVTVAGREGHNAVLDVGSIDDLVRLAERYDALILDEERADSHTYVLQIDRTTYRYRPAQPGAPPVSVRAV